MTTPNRQTQPNDMRRSTTDGRNDQLRYWLADGNFDVAVADFTGMPTGVELVDFYQERMVLILWLDLAGGGTPPDETAIGTGDLSSLERCPFLLGNPQDIDERIGDMLFRRAGFAPVAAGREPHTRSASAYPPATTGGARSMISSTARAGASAPLTGMIPAGTVGSRLIVVEHGLDVVAVGIMDERGIVARPVVRARTGLAVVGAAGRETRLMERLDGVGGFGAERDV